MRVRPFLSEQPSVSATLRNPADICEYVNDIGPGALWAAKVRSLGPRVILCGDMTELNSIAIWQRNVYLILFLIACLVANIVLWMRRKCFSRSDRAPYLETNPFFAK